MQWTIIEGFQLPAGRCALQLNDKSNFRIFPWRAGHYYYYCMKTGSSDLSLAALLFVSAMVAVPTYNELTLPYYYYNCYKLYRVLSKITAETILVKTIGTVKCRHY